MNRNDVLSDIRQNSVYPERQKILEAPWFDQDNYRFRYPGESSEMSNWFYNWFMILLPILVFMYRSYSNDVIQEKRYFDQTAGIEGPVRIDFDRQLARLHVALPLNQLV